MWGPCWHRLNHINPFGSWDDLAMAAADSPTDLVVIDPRGDRAEQAEAMDRACTELGFFRIPFGVIDEAVREAAWNDAKRFFAQPLDTKLAVAFPEPGYPYGYAPLGFEVLAASTTDGQAGVGAPDLKETYSVGPDCLGPIPTTNDPAEAWLRSPSMWATEPTSLTTSLPAYFKALTDVSAQLLSLMATALDLPDNHFEPLIDRHTGALRSLRYPELDGEPTNGSLRAGPHSDYGTLTILRTDGVPGLEVLNGDGEWSPITHDPHTFVVNLGDSIQQWTNDRWRSTVHRVTPVSTEERHSMAFFHMANWDASIECLPTCHDAANPPRYEPVLAGPWLMSKFQKTVKSAD